MPVCQKQIYPTALTYWHICGSGFGIYTEQSCTLLGIYNEYSPKSKVSTPLPGPWFPALKPGEPEMQSCECGLRWC